jgi:hypothetical protein
MLSCMEISLRMNPAFELWWGEFDWDDEDDWLDELVKGADKNLLPIRF